MTRQDREVRGEQMKRRRLSDQERLWRSVPESDVLRNVMSYIWQIGGYCYRQNSGAMVSEHNGKKRFTRFGEPGASDLVAIVPTSSTGSVTLFIETKTETGKQSPEQQAWQQQLTEVNGIYVVCRPSDWQDEIDRAIAAATK